MQPDIDTPFVDARDVVRRLLPYHIFQHPKEDLEAIAYSNSPAPISGKGKRKASEEDLLREEIAGVYHVLHRAPLEYVTNGPHFSFK